MSMNLDFPSAIENCQHVMPRHLQEPLESRLKISIQMLKLKFSILCTPHSPISFRNACARNHRILGQSQTASVG